MPRITRTATVVWRGDLPRGSGEISAGSGAFSSLPYSLPSRVAAPEGKTSPEELLAAAHAGCFTMSLAGELATAGGAADALEAECEILMDEVPGQGHQIVGSTIRLRAATALEQTAFDEAVARADDGCPFSALLRRAGATVLIEARRAKPPAG